MTCRPGRASTREGVPRASRAPHHKPGDGLCHTRSQESPLETRTPGLLKPGTVNVGQTVLGGPALCAGGCLAAPRLPRPPGTPDVTPVSPGEENQAGAEPGLGTAPWPARRVADGRLQSPAVPFLSDLLSCLKLSEPHRPRGRSGGWGARSGGSRGARGRSGTVASLLGSPGPVVVGSVARPPPP